MQKRRSRPGWWGGQRHILYTVIVFVVLASLDNAALGILPPLYPVISGALGVREAAVGVVMALNILIVGFSSAGWGYWGDRGSRKRILLYGSALWGAMTFLSGAAQSYTQFLALQVVAAVGLGCAASVGFSIVGDFIAPHRRGLVMSLWGLTQGMGLGGGLLVSGLLGATDWRLPFYLVASAGLVFTLLWLLAYEPERGRMEPDLRRLFQAHARYEYRIRLGDVVRLVTTGSNFWLIVQNFTAQLAYGSLIWLPRLVAAKMQADGHSLETATMIASLFAIVFNIGGLFSVVGGYLGDRWQRRDLRGRTLISAVGIWGAIPFYLLLFFLPLPLLPLAEGAEPLEVIGTVLVGLVTNPWIAAAFGIALLALLFTSLDSPNWFALVNDINLPEHRGTVFGIATMVYGAGRALGNGLAGVAFALLGGQVGTPWNYVLGLALFQMAFVPTGLFYLLASRTTPRDILLTRERMAQRAQEALAGRD